MLPSLSNPAANHIYAVDILLEADFNDFFAHSMLQPLLCQFWNT